jgi:hypothetical protein
MEKDKLKVLLRESLSMFEAEKVDNEEEVDNEDKEDKEVGKSESGEQSVSKGEQEDLNKISKSVYSLGIGGELSRCVFGKSDKNRTLQSKLRKYMKGDPYAEKGHPDVGETPKSIARKVIGCITKIRAKLAKV